MYAEADDEAAVDEVVVEGGVDFVEPEADDGRSGGDGGEDGAVLAVHGEGAAAVAAVAESRFDTDVTHSVREIVKYTGRERGGREIVKYIGRERERERGGRERLMD